MVNVLPVSGSTTLTVRHGQAMLRIAFKVLVGGAAGIVLAVTAVATVVYQTVKNIQSEEPLD